MKSQIGIARDKHGGFIFDFHLAWGMFQWHPVFWNLYLDVYFFTILFHFPGKLRIISNF